jgi:hypothetical protein
MWNISITGSVITHDARFARQTGIDMTKAAFNNKMILFTSKLDLNLGRNK